MAIQLPYSLPHIGEFNLEDIMGAIVHAGFVVVLITIFLKSAGVETSWRTRALAAFGIVAIDLPAYLGL
jgi:hypothetical protein